MSKLDKHANLYDKDGNLLRHVNAQGILEDYTIEELEELINKIQEDKDENGNIKHPKALQNCLTILFQLYDKYGNPHQEEIIKEIQRLGAKKSVNEQVTDALEEAKTEVENGEFYKGVDEEYAEYEEVK